MVCISILNPLIKHIRFYLFNNLNYIDSWGNECSMFTIPEFQELSDPHLHINVFAERDGTSIGL